MFYKSETKTRYYLSLLGGFLIHLVIGTVYITGNINIYLASYLQHEGDNITLNNLAIILPLQITGTSIGLFIGSYLTQRFNPWLTTTIGNSIVISAVFISSFLKVYGVIILIYGLFYGIGVGISYTTPLIISWSHFPEHKGRISGIIISGFGFGSAIFNLVATAMINPDNSKPDHKIHGQKYFKSDIANRFPGTLRWLALIYLLLSFLGILLLTRPAKRVQEENLIDDNSKNDECPDVITGVKTKRFWVLCAMALMSVTPGLYILNVYKSFGKQQINDDQFLSIVGSISSIFNGSFRYVWGQLMDYSSFKKSYAALIAIQTVFIMTAYYISTIPALYLIWVCIIVCCEGGHFSLFPTIVARMFGKKMGSKVYSVLFYSFAFGAWLGFLIQDFLNPVVGYQGLFWTLGSISLLSLVVLYFFTEVNIWSEEKKEMKSRSVVNE